MRVIKDDNGYVQEVNINIKQDDICMSTVSIDYKIYCINPLIELSNNKGKNTARLYINDEVFMDYEGDMDFTNGKKVHIGSCDFDIYSGETKILKLKTVWDFKKSQIKESSLVSDIVVPKIDVIRPIINCGVSRVVNGEAEIYYDIVNDYSHIDYKLNDSGWVRIKNKPFVVKINRSMSNYLVIRAYNENTGLYGYSETVKIN